MQQLNEILPDLEQSSPLCDILTEEDKASILAHELNRIRAQYEWKYKDLGMKPAQIMAKISEVNLESLIDSEKVLREANYRMHIHVNKAKEQEAKKQAAIDSRRALVEKCNYGYFYKLIKSHYENFIYDSSNELYIKALCFFFSGDPRFETELGFSFRKGFLIIGTAGLGKTSAIKAISRNEIYPIGIVSMIDIAERVREFGTVELNTSEFILLDDVGTEPEVVNHFGTKINWFKDFIETYYLNNQVYSKLLVTTNCGGDEIEKRYGYRVRSRMKEIFNTIHLTGNDKRK